MKQDLLKDKDQTVEFIPPFLQNRPAIASAATLAIKKPSGETVVAAGTSVTAIDSSTGKLTYDISAATLNELGENWIVEWAYTVSSVVYYETTLFDVVLHKLSILLTDEDLYKLQGDIKTKNESIEGSVTSSTASTLVATDNIKNYADDYFNGGIVEVLNVSNGAKQSRLITDHVQSTGTLSISPDWATNPDNTYKYIAYRPFRNKVEFAWEELMGDIRAQGFRPALIMNSIDLKVVHAYKTIEHICLDFTKDDDQDVWSRLYEIYKGKYNEAFAKLKFQYDSNEDGEISSAEGNKTTGQFYLNR